MTAEEAASQKFVDREIEHIRREVGHVRELWDQQKGSDVAALLIRTAEIERRLGDLNHAHARAQEVAQSTVSSSRYEEQMTDVRAAIQTIKDGASAALATQVADLSRQLQALKDVDQANKEEATAALTALDSRVTIDIAKRSGEASSVAGIAKKASDRALMFGVIGAVFGGIGLLLGIATFTLRFFAATEGGGAP